MDTPYLLFLGDAGDDLAAKSARGVVDWRPEWCLGQLRLEGCKTSLGLAEMSVEEAASAGARTMIVGVANAGGFIPDSWTATIVGALAAGMDVASGMHTRLATIAEIRDAAARYGKSLFDVRHPGQSFSVGNGDPRPGLRLLTVGTDCSCGKMYTALAIEREMRERGMKVDFRATGQSGIFIAGDGVAVDAVVADFISGAVEWLAPANDSDHWDLIEGQGSLFHPSFAGVSLGLLHGAQPDALVLCHEPTRTHMRGLPGRALPGLAECIDANLAAARLTNPAARCVGLAIDTSRLDQAARERLLAETGSELGIACVDPFAIGVGPIVDALA
ncbi:MAG: DUF1611 domain-containing protein [Proteobacteria bacterium]|nr:DUF1611 domain-containing protein [Pseudomonadota bacterium]